MCLRANLSLTPTLTSKPQVLQRLQTQSPPGASPRPIFTGATASSYVSDRDIASALASGYGRIPLTLLEIAVQG